MQKMPGDEHLVFPSLTESRSHPNHWYNRAADLRAAAGAVWFAMEKDREKEIAEQLGLPEYYSMSVACWPVYHMLCGLALEVVFKAVMAYRRMQIPESHDLNNLAGLANFKRTPKERDLLKYYTSAIVWAGRYPIPKNCSDESLHGFYGIATAALRKPVQLGSLTLSTPNGASDWENFHALWLRVAEHFEFTC